MTQTHSMKFVAPPTLARFLKDDSFVRCVVGPFGSGKSSACTVELLRRSAAQEPGPDGIRRSRWAVVRNTYRELADTTRKTVDDWIPSAIANYHEASATLHVQYNDVYAEILFRALDRPQDAAKLYSLELTGAWLNEAREIPKGVFDVLTGRVGRFPPKNIGGASWSGIWMDTNPPDNDHWIYTTFIEKLANNPEQLEGYAFYRQPGGRHRDAENLENLPKDYYNRLVMGKNQEWIRVFVDGEFGFISDGRPVFPEFLPSLHVDSKLSPLPNHFPLLVGIDFGLTPAAVIGQEDSDGQIQILDEVVTEDMGAVRFAEQLGSRIRSGYPGRSIRGWGDPAGMQRSQVDERTPFDVLHASNLPIDPAHTNDFVLRREAVGVSLQRLTMRGRPSLAIHPRCSTLVKAMGGGYCFRRIQTGGERYADAPLKDRFSHVAEALGYLMIGMGRDTHALDNPYQTKSKYKVIRASAAGVHNRRDPGGSS
jgi:Phage terminase large subunit